MATGSEMARTDPAPSGHRAHDIAGPEDDEASVASSGGRSSSIISQGLMLMRASNMKVVRLQLALERRDRRVALESVDDLVLLDGKIRDLLNEMPTSGAGTLLQQQLDQERRALAREKLTLAAGFSGQAAVLDLRPWLEPAPPVEAEAEDAPPLVEAQPEPPPQIEAETVVEAEAAPRRASPFLIVGLLLVVTILACLFFLLGTAAGQDVRTRLSSSIGALR